jgi:hypothetical protein
MTKYKVRQVPRAVLVNRDAQAWDFLITKGPRLSSGTDTTTTQAEPRAEFKGAPYSTLYCIHKRKSNVVHIFIFCLKMYTNIPFSVCEHFF